MPLMKEGRAAICILPCLLVLANESGGQGFADWCSSTYIPLIPQNSLKVTRKKPVVSKLSFLSWGSLTENNVVMANGKMLKTTTMDLGTEKMLGSYTPSDEWASITCQLLVCLVLYLWYILISCQKLVELLVLPTCTQMLWHKMTPKKSRRDGSGVSARAPLEPFTERVKWRSCFDGCSFVSHCWLSPSAGLEQLKGLWLPASLPCSWLLLLHSLRDWRWVFEATWRWEAESEFEGESSGKSPSFLLRQWRGNTQLLPLTQWQTPALLGVW